MAQDDTDRKDEYEAERDAEIDEELERIGRDPDEVDEGSTDLGTQNAPRTDDQADDLEEAEGEDEEAEGEEETGGETEEAEGEEETGGENEEAEGEEEAEGDVQESTANSD